MPSGNVFMSYAHSGVNRSICVRDALTRWGVTVPQRIYAVPLVVD
jgi:hypothetical protein